MTKNVKELGIEMEAALTRLESSNVKEDVEQQWKTIIGESALTLSQMRTALEEIKQQLSDSSFPEDVKKILLESVLGDEEQIAKLIDTGMQELLGPTPERVKSAYESLPGLITTASQLFESPIDNRAVETQYESRVHLQNTMALINNAFSLSSISFREHEHALKMKDSLKGFRSRLNAVHETLSAANLIEENQKKEPGNTLINTALENFSFIVNNLKSRFLSKNKSDLKEEIEGPKSKF